MSAKGRSINSRYRLEKNSERQVITLREARALMPAADDDVLAAVYDYWIDKRMKHVMSRR